MHTLSNSKEKYIINCVVDMNYKEKMDWLVIHVLSMGLFEPQVKAGNLSVAVPSS